MRKRLLFFTLLLLLIQVAFAQQEPRPDWVRNTPLPSRGANFIIVYGMGIGTTEQEAELNAWKNALFKVSNELGINYSKQIV